MQGAWCRTGLFQDQQEAQRQPPLGGDRQVTAHFLSLPHRMVLGLCFTVQGVGKGVLSKMKGADGRGKLRHHSMQTADSIPQIVSGSLSAAAGAQGCGVRGCLQLSPTRDGHFYTKQYPVLERSERDGKQGIDPSTKGETRVYHQSAPRQQKGPKAPTRPASPCTPQPTPCNNDTGRSENPKSSGKPNYPFTWGNNVQTKETPYP